MLSLINDPWLPVKDRDGNIRRIRPIDILDESIVELAWQRADFQGAGYQFLIALLQTAVAPEDREVWEETWDGSINAEQLKAAFSKLEPAFRLSSEKPSFMQDFSSLEGDLLSIANLLIEAPGGNTLKLNKDHFVKRGMVNQMCPACAAMALFTLQINAPSGGQGHRTSLRGGGPMTSLVWPMDPKTPLWRRLWLNVLTLDLLPGRNVPTAVDATLFPWCGVTRTSEKADGMTTPEMVDKRQVYWGMPRRIELDFTQLSQGECDLCGSHSETLITGYRTKNYGMQYDGWIHPLTPYRQDLKNPTAPLLSVKGQPGGLLYKDWLGLIWLGQSDLNREVPATVVTQAAAIRPGGIVLGLHCFGFDMDNMKARCWYQHQLPLPYIDESLREEFLVWLRRAVVAAKDGITELRNAIKKAWYQSPKDARGDFSFIDQSFWQETEPVFMELMDTLKTGFSQQPKDLSPLIKWRDYLKRELLRRFDDVVFTSPEQQQDLRQEIAARKTLYDALYKSAAFRAIDLKEQQ
jgi:CRISPR system Cascade subunit CasA